MPNNDMNLKNIINKIESIILQDDTTSIPTSHVIYHELQVLLQYITELQEQLNVLQAVSPEDMFSTTIPIPGSTLTNAYLTSNKIISNITEVLSRLVLNRKSIEDLDIDQLSTDPHHIPSSYLIDQLIQDIQYQIDFLKIPKTIVLLQEFPQNLLLTDVYKKLKYSNNIVYSEGRLECIIRDYIRSNIQGEINITPVALDKDGIYFVILKIHEFNDGEILIYDYSHTLMDTITPDKIRSWGNIFMYFTEQKFNNNIFIEIKNATRYSTIKFDISLIRFNTDMYQAIIKLFMHSLDLLEVPTLPTQTNNTSLANTAFVHNAINTYLTTSVQQDLYMDFDTSNVSLATFPYFISSKYQYISIFAQQTNGSNMTIELAVNDDSVVTPIYLSNVSMSLNNFHDKFVQFIPHISNGTKGSCLIQLTNVPILI
jgi:hypothetical protein